MFLFHKNPFRNKGDISDQSLSSTPPQWWHYGGGVLVWWRLTVFLLFYTAFTTKEHFQIFGEIVQKTLKMSKFNVI